jgi:DNA invertase Pin-like site-specific DNA recombinase
MRRRLTSLLLVTLLGAGSIIPAAAAQEPSDQKRPPTELWDEFPLEQPPPESSRGSAPQGSASPGSRNPAPADDGSSATIPLLAAALVGLAALALASGVAVRRRRSRPAASPEAPPSPVTPALVANAGIEAQPSHLPAATATKPAAEKKPAAVAARAERAHGNGAPPVPVSEDAREARAAPRPGPRPRVPSHRALGYASVSAADGQASDELKVQIRMIQEACERRGLTLVKVVRDIESHASSDLRRPGLTYALDRLAARDASCLVVASIERLTRTASHLGTMLGWLNECDARLIVIDLDLDTGTHEGQLGAKALSTLGGLERKKVEERTRKGLEAARHMRRSGRPAVSDRPSLKQRISDMRAEGMTLQAIADTLNAEGVPTLRGGAEWRPSSVQAAAGYKRPSRKDRLRRATPREGRPKAS